MVVAKGVNENIYNLLFYVMVAILPVSSTKVPSHTKQKQLTKCVPLVAPEVIYSVEQDELFTVITIYWRNANEDTLIR